MGDMRGHRLTDPFTPSDNGDMLIKDVVELVHAMKFEKPFLMGHSMGAATVMRIGAEYSELVRAIIMLDPWAGRGGFNLTKVSRATSDLTDNDAQGCFVRIEFTSMAAQSTASVAKFKVYPARYESEYYDVTYRYRLRWNDVISQPGELKVVVYKQGAKLGEKVMRTAGPPASVRLTPDRTDLSATEEGLSFILVEAMDAQENPVPLAANMIEFDVAGAGPIAAVDNSDQLSLEAFQNNRHALFNVKAMLVVCTKEGQVGPIHVTARSAGLLQRLCRCRSYVEFTHYHHEHSRYIPKLRGPVGIRPRREV